MSFAAFKKKAHALLDEADWIAHIKNEHGYELALRLMDNLIEPQFPVFIVLNQAFVARSRQNSKKSAELAR